MYSVDGRIRHDPECPKRAAHAQPRIEGASKSRPVCTCGASKARREARRRAERRAEAYWNSSPWDR